MCFSLYVCFYAPSVNRVRSAIVLRCPIPAQSLRRVKGFVLNIRVVLPVSSSKRNYMEHSVGYLVILCFECILLAFAE